MNMQHKITTVILFTTQDGLINNRILGVQEDKLGNVYFDTPEGVSKFDGQQFTTLKVTENSAKKNEWKLAPTDLWFGTGSPKIKIIRISTLHFFSTNRFQIIEKFST